jgi:hypothetical protein
MKSVSQYAQERDKCEILLTRIFYDVTAICYKPEGRGFDSRLGHWIFFFYWPNPSSRTMAL